MRKALSERGTLPVRRIGGAAAAAVLAIGLLAGSGPAAARPAPASFADLVETVGPAVVQITTTGAATALADGPAELPEAFRRGPFKEFFDRHFGDQSPENRQTPGPRASGLGSGFIVDADGHVVTNNHVVAGASEITVSLTDGRELTAEVIGTDQKTDLAVLRVKTDAPLPTVAWGDSDAIRVGDWVVAVGNPFGLHGTATAGIVSARGRNIGAGPYDDFIQIDAPINRGNSGGPLFDGDGRVVGVNTAIFSPSGGNVGIGFAIPAAIARDVVAELIDSGQVKRGWLGVMIQPVTTDIADSLGLDKAAGALVARVEPDSPAAQGGLRTGDVVMTFDGRSIDTVRDLSRAAASAKAGITAPVTVWRNDAPVTLDVTIGAAPTTVAAARPAATDETLVVEGMGLSVAALDDGARARFGVGADTAGVVVIDVDANADAARKGLRPGDVITQAGGVEIVTPADLQEAVKAARSAERASVLVLLERDGMTRFVAVAIADA